MTVEG